MAVAMRCCGELYARRPSFNLSEDVLRVAAPGLDHADDVVRQSALKSLRRAIGDDRSGAASLSVAKAIHGLLRDRKGGLRRQ